MTHYVRRMIRAALLALQDLFSASFRSVLFKAIGLTLLLFIVLFLGVQALFWFLNFVSLAWVDTLLAVGAGLTMLVLFFFLMAPVTALFAGLFLDDVAAKVEGAHYPNDPPGVPLSVIKGLGVSLRFGALLLLVNILALPLVFTGIGAVALVIINAYMLSREYFEMAAMRHMAIDEAREFRKANAVDVFVAGLLPALMALVPVLNLLVPLFSTSYFVHLFKGLKRSSA